MTDWGTTGSSCITNFDIPQNYQHIVLYDSGPDNPRRILTIGHTDLGPLSVEDFVFGNGTFDVTPLIFFKLYITLQSWCSLSSVCLLSFTQQNWGDVLQNDCYFKDYITFRSSSERFGWLWASSCQCLHKRIPSSSYKRLFFHFFPKCFIFIIDFSQTQHGPYHNKHNRIPQEHKNG